MNYGDSNCTTLKKDVKKKRKKDVEAMKQKSVEEIRWLILYR